jgi:membrane protease YdiL (CAAX protease family)
MLHYTYPWWVIAIIFVDGLILGLARWKTGSVIAPVVMHMLYNLYAIW